MSEAKQEVVVDEKKVALAQIRINYQQCFATPEGEKVIADLIDECGFIRSSMVDGDPYGTAFNEGKRQVIVDILNKLNTDPEKLLQILKGNRRR